MDLIKVIVIVIVFCFGAPLASGELMYYVTLFDPLPEGHASYAQSIADSGLVVGSMQREKVGGWTYGRATLYISANTHIDLGELNGTSSEAHAICNSGIIVGEASYQEIPGGPKMVHAVIFDSSGGGNNIDLGQGYAWAVNNNIQVVGQQPAGPATHRAVLWDTVNGTVDLGTLGGEGSTARGINDNGVIIGDAETPFVEGVGVLTRATIFDPTGGGNNVDLGTLGGWGSSAHSINSLGDIVGYSRTESNENHATLFDPSGDGKNIDLGILGGGIQSTAYSISDTGQIVGWAYPLESDIAHATLFDPTGNGNNIDLNTVIDPSYSGPHLRLALDINNHGWIVGVAGQGESYRGFLLTPIPEPATLSLLLLGGMGLVRRKWRE